MALLGQAALAMWWDMDAAMRPEFEDWHTHEHFRERLGIPGFLRATRWSAADGGEGVFQVYELASHDVLSSAAYVERLNAPTPWSARLMPHHRHMVRTQCRVVASAGAAVARHALTVRVSARAGCGESLDALLADTARRLADRPGLAGGHLLRHEPPPLAQTTEQKIRGGDRSADRVFVAIGYDADRLRAVAQGELGRDALAQAGAGDGIEQGLFTLSLSAVPGDRR